MLSIRFLMPLRLEISRLARSDFRRIAAYLSKEAGHEVAARFVLHLENRCREIPPAPGMGTPYPGRSGVRKVIEGNYKIIYRTTDSAIIILRIWDGRRGSEARL